MSPKAKSRWDAIRLEYADFGVYEVYQRGRFVGLLYEYPTGEATIPVRIGNAHLEGYAKRWLDWMNEKPGYTLPEFANQLRKAGFDVEVSQ